MASTEETYRAAAKEHLSRAQAQFDADEYFLAHYLAGLAVECHLRALMRQRSNDFDPRHDLVELANDARPEQAPGYLPDLWPNAGPELRPDRPHPEALRPIRLADVLL